MMNAKRAIPFEVHATARLPLGMPAARFLREYWQKQPLLIRGGFGKEFTSPITPNDLAGLACEPMALSRLIVHSPRADRWRVENGPLAEQRFSKLPKTHWTLLVQDVDKWDADVAALYRYIDFLPSWRLDDIMISYAVTGGSVGAHVDQYDVFLLQGLGHRRWQIDANVDPPLAFRDDVALKLLREFNPSHEWVLAPGDALYLPPGVPHHGVALDECMTISLGMRAPSAGELILDLAESLVVDLPEDQRYADPDLLARADRQLIDAGDIRRLKSAMAALHTLDDAQLGDWFGGFITRYRMAQTPAPSGRPFTEAALTHKLTRGARLIRHPFARLAASRSGQAYHVFFAGDRFVVSKRLYRLLSHPEQIDGATWSGLTAKERQSLLTIINSGHFGVGR